MSEKATTSRRIVNKSFLFLSIGNALFNPEHDKPKESNSLRNYNWFIAIH